MCLKSSAATLRCRTLPMLSGCNYNFEDKPKQQLGLWHSQHFVSVVGCKSMVSACSACGYSSGCLATSLMLMDSRAVGSRCEWANVPHLLLACDKSASRLVHAPEQCAVWCHVACIVSIPIKSYGHYQTFKSRFLLVPPHVALNRGVSWEGCSDVVTSLA